jgi:hypothetical protein
MIEKTHCHIIKCHKTSNYYWYVIVFS